MATVLKTKFQLRRGNAEVWARNNPVLERGEPGFEIDTGRLKIGNGQTAWNDLEYLAPQSGAGGGVQHDWNQNDETAADYIKNRPFYTGDPVETVFVAESTVTFVSANGIYMADIQSTVSATVGETYKVYWDGTAYECTCVPLRDMSVIGNLSIAGAGSDTGEPFVIAIMNGKGIQIGTTDTSASHTFSISRFAQEIVKIDAKYLPNTISVYNFPRSVEHDQMVDAIEAFNIGNANIVWDRKNVINASYYQSDDIISIVFADEPLMTYIYLNENGFYESTLGHARYEEVEVGRVRIGNDSGIDTVLYTEGTSYSDNTLKVGAEKISTSSGSGISTHEIILSSTTTTGGNRKKFRITVDNSGAPTITDESDSSNVWKPANLPTVTESDAGKFLRVSGTGEWVAETILSASEVSF